MATKKSKPQSRADRNLPPTPSPACNFASLHQHIEAERSRLSDAEAVLDCMIVAMVEDVRLDAAGPNYSNAARVVRGLVSKAIDRLDSVNVKTAIAAPDGSGNVCSGTSVIEDVYGGVKEAVPAYVH